MTKVTFSQSIGGDGSSVSDDDDPITGLDDGGHETRFVPALKQFVAMSEFTRNSASELAIELAAQQVTAAERDKIISNTVVSYLGGQQPDTAEAGVFYTPIHIITEQDSGKDFVASLTTTDHLPIWEANGTETKSAGLTLAGTGAAQTITLWSPSGEAVRFSSTDSYITAFSADNASSGLKQFVVSGSNNLIDVSVLSTLRLQVLSVNAVSTGDLSGLVSVSTLTIAGISTISGSISRLTLLTSLYAVAGQFSGDISKLKSLQTAVILGQTSVSGDIKDLSKIKRMVVNGANSLQMSQPASFENPMTDFKVYGLVKDQAFVDNVLKSLESVSWQGIKQVDLSWHAVPSSAGADSKAIIEANGATVLVST